MPRLFKFAERSRRALAHVLGRLILSLSCCLALGLLAPNAAPRAAAQVSGASAQLAGAPVAPLVNPDGTLNLDKGFSGALNLSGWNVTLDARRGPILTRQGSGAQAPTGVTTMAAGSDPRAAPSGGPTAAAFWLPLPDAGLHGTVYVMAVSGSDLYVGGDIDVTSDGVVSNLGGIARFSHGAWSAFPHHGLNGHVYALALQGDDLYVGGDFNSTTDVAVTNLWGIAKFSNGAWSSFPHGGMNGSVFALAFLGTDLYVGGAFGGTHDCLTVPLSCVSDLNGIAKFSGGAWSALPHKGLNNNVMALAVIGFDVYAGGLFTGTGDCFTTPQSCVMDLNGIAKFSAGAWSALPRKGLAGAVYALAVSGSDLYAGGSFLQTGDGVLKNLGSIALLSGGGWSRLDHQGLAGTVYALGASGSDIYAGGSFHQTGDSAIGNLNNVAHFKQTDILTVTSTPKWSALPNAGLNDRVYALAAAGGTVYAGGLFNGTYDGRVTMYAIGELTNDTDGDGIPDDWERNGVTFNGQFIDLPAMGANPLHKDVFVHADWMNSAGLKPQARDIQIVSDAFNRAPLPNPDGTTGVHLHVDLGPDSVMNPVTGATWGALSKAGPLPYHATIGYSQSFEYHWDDFDAIKQTYFAPTQRAAVFHYMCFCSTVGNYPYVTGVSRGVPAHDFLVTLGGWPVPGGTSLQKAGSFMTWLGENLGLIADYRKRGNPNYLSVMNYTFQTIGLLRPSGGQIQREFNYSARQLPTLDENHLDESIGISDPDGHLTLWYTGTSNYCSAHPNDYFSHLAYPATDWNCDGLLTSGQITATPPVDINGDTNFTQLNGLADWPAVVFDARGQIGQPPAAPAGASPLAPSDVLTTTIDGATYQQISAAVPPALFNAETSAPIDIVTDSPASGAAPLHVAFNGSASTTPTGTITSWVWDFGDNTVGAGATISHTYATPGTYYATLRVTNSNGKVNLVALDHRVTVSAIVKLFLPLLRR